MTIAIEKDWAKWRKEHPYVRHARAAMFLFHRGHAAFHASRYGAAHRNLKKWHDRISSVGQHTGPEGSNPLPGNLGGFAGAIQSAHHYVGQALPHIQALVSHPAAQTHFQSAHGHLALAAHHIGTATMLAHQLAPLLKEEEIQSPDLAKDPVAKTEVPDREAVLQWLEKAYEGAHTPAGEARAEPLKEYWTHGKGAAKIRWGEGGDFDRCVNELEKHMPGRAKGYCNLLHKHALGIYPATHAKLDRAGKGDVNVKKAEDVSTHKSFKAGNHTPLSISKSEDDDLADFVRYHAERALREDQ